MGLGNGAVVLDPPEGHTSSIMSVTFSPDGNRIASGLGDGTVRCWDAITRAVVFGSFITDRNAVYCVRFSPDGKRVAYGGGDGKIVVLNAHTGVPVPEPFKAHSSGGVYTIAFSPDGTRIVSGSSDESTVKVWDARTGIQASFGTLIGHDDGIRAVAFSPDGERIMSASKDGTIRLWDAKRGTPFAVPVIAHPKPVYCAVFSPDGKQIVSGSGDNEIRVFDATDTGTLSAGPFKADMESSLVQSLAISPDGRYVVSSSYCSNNIQVWYQV